jgi:hypothetical protein
VTITAEDVAIFESCTFSNKHWRMGALLKAALGAGLV